MMQPCHLLITVGCMLLLPCRPAYKFVPNPTHVLLVGSRQQAYVTGTYAPAAVVDFYGSLSCMLDWVT
jgi:hypothetical protein